MSAEASSLLDSPPVPRWLCRLLPFLCWLPSVRRASLKADLIAGLTGSIIVLPQAVAFATIAGLPPQYGLYAAMVPSAAAALLGSSRHLVSGPTTAISIVVFASISPLAEPGSPQYISLVLTLTFLTGVFQVVMGLARLGGLVNFISHTVIIGFTAGAAILICSSQLKNFFGLGIPRGASVIEIVAYFFGHLAEIQPMVVLVGALTLGVGILARRILPRVYMIAAMVAGSLAAYALNLSYDAGIRTVGALPSHLPPLSMPDFSSSAIQQTTFSAMIITILALTEAVAIARSIAVKSGPSIDSNQEFIGQGLSNILGGFFSGYASSGSFNRSGVNYAAGAETPLAAVFSAAFLAVIVLVVAPLAAYLPIPAMAGILFLVAWGLIDLHHIGAILRQHRRESVVLAITFFGTLIDLEKGIFLGIITSLIFYLHRTSHPNIRPYAPIAADIADPRRKFTDAGPEAPRCPQLEMIRMEGSIFFGAVEHVQHAFKAIDARAPCKRHLMLFSRAVNFIDLAGAELLAKEAERRRALGGGLYLVGVQPGFSRMLITGGHVHKVGAENLFKTKGEAIPAVYSHLDPEVCRTCTARIFRECHQSLPSGEPRPAT